MKEITLYTDGACSGNPGPGGWGGASRCEFQKCPHSLLRKAENRSGMATRPKPQKLEEI